MNAPAIIEGDYVDLKFIRTRSVCQMVIEVTIERGEEIVRMFGTPRPSTGVPVAVARLNEEGGDADTRADDKPGPRLHKSQPDADPAPASGKRHFSDLPLSQQAALMCDRQDFDGWIWKRYTDTYPKALYKDAADAVRTLCGVLTRAEFDRDPIAAKAWKELYSQFQATQISEAYERR